MNKPTHVSQWINNGIINEVAWSLFSLADGVLRENEQVQVVVAGEVYGVQKLGLDVSYEGVIFATLINGRDAFLDMSKLTAVMSLEGARGPMPIM